MARAGRKDRGLLSKPDATGKPVWYVRLYHEGKERRFGSFKTKTEARDFYEKAKQEQKAGRFFPERYRLGGYAKLHDVLEGYLAAFTGRSKRDESRFARKWLALFPAARLNMLTPATLEHARAKLLDEGRAPQTVNRYLAFLRRVLNKAVRDGHLASNPVSRIRMFKEPSGKTRFLTPEEEQKVLEALGPVYARWARLAILTGLRQKEQFSLKWADVDLAGGRITLSETKAGGVQHLYLNEEAREILRSLDSWQRSKWVFPSGNSQTHVDPRNFYRRVWLPAMQGVGIEWATWHDLRHTFASRLAMSGATEGTIAALLRHSGTALVRRYAHLSPSHLQMEVEKVAAYGKGRDGERASREAAQGKGEKSPGLNEGPAAAQSEPVSRPTVTETGMA